MSAPELRRAVVALLALLAWALVLTAAETDRQPAESPLPLRWDATDEEYDRWEARERAVIDAARLGLRSWR